MMRGSFVFSNIYIMTCHEKKNQNYYQQIIILDYFIAQYIKICNMLLNQLYIHPYFNPSKKHRKEVHFRTEYII